MDTILKNTNTNYVYKTICINLSGSVDCKEKISKIDKSFELKNAESDQNINNNDNMNIKKFNYRKGFASCPYSHYNIWNQLLDDKSSDFYLIFEDDINFFDEDDDAYKSKLNLVIDQMNLSLHIYDIIFLGYTMYPEDRRKNVNNNIPKIENLKKDIYLGGFFNYIITKSGASKFVKYIDTHKIVHRIDYIVKIVPELNLYEVVPQLAYSEWIQSLDSDKNHDFTFYPLLDSRGYDFKFVGKKCVSDLMNECIIDPNCVAFNTLGFLKNKILKFEPTPYFDHDDGLYVYNKRVNRNIIESQFDFYLNLDSPGYDIEYIGEKNISELMQLAIRNENCVGFNTLGFMKYYIGNMESLQNLQSESDGLYVVRDRYEKIKYNKTVVSKVTKKIYEENVNVNISEKDVYQNVCFIHSCNLGDTSVLDSIIDHIIFSGLIDILDKIWVVNIGIPIDNRFQTNEKIKIIQYSDATDTFELETINMIYRFSQSHSNVKVLYIHTKGVSRHGNDSPYITDWRNYMLYFLVDKYVEYLGSNLELLDEFNTVGVNYGSKPHHHFSGNFWWATTNYIRTLKPIYSGIRHDAEWWILSNSEVNFKELYNSGIDHYKNLYPKSMYSKN